MGSCSSASPDSATALKPPTVTRRFDRLAKRLGIDRNFHKLRHYSATELINAGVDIRTVAGRLGHGGGGTTTLRVYTAWLSEADQRAAESLAPRMPIWPNSDQGPETAMARANPRHPYERIVADIYQRIASGELSAGDQLPTVVELAADHNATPATVSRAFALLRTRGLVTVQRGARATIAEQQPAAFAGGLPASSGPERTTTDKPRERD